MPDLEEPPTPTLGALLERQRLEHRADRLRRAIAALRDRHEAVAAVGPAPAALRQAIADFSAELTAIERQLR